MRLIGALIGIADEPITHARYNAFLEGLKELGWTDGRNIRVEYRYGGGDLENTRRQAVELVALAPDVILVAGGAATDRLLQVTRTVPIVFVLVPDPVGSGFVARLSRPGGNATGFMQFEYSLTGKWLELLKQIAPGVTRVAVLREPGITAGIGQFAAIQSVAPSLRVEVSPINISDATEIEHGISVFAREANGGLIVSASSLAITHRELIATLAARYKLPAVYPSRDYAASGGLISYGPNF
jgi:putative ABC transport system substrate-binding protein